MQTRRVPAGPFAIRLREDPACCYHFHPPIGPALRAGDLGEFGRRAQLWVEKDQQWVKEEEEHGTRRESRLGFMVKMRAERIGWNRILCLGLPVIALLWYFNSHSDKGHKDPTPYEENPSLFPVVAIGVVAFCACCAWLEPLPQAAWSNPCWWMQWIAATVVTGLLSMFCGGSNPVCACRTPNFRFISNPLLSIQPSGCI